jgi:hypothetical protein
LVELIGRRVSVSGELGEGGLGRFKLPLARGRACSRPGRDRRRPVPAGSRCYCAEDSTNQSSSLLDIGASWVETDSSPWRRCHDIDLVLMDGRMPRWTARPQPR